MTNKFLSQARLEQLLYDLQVNQVELQNLDCKAILNLKEHGDRATLIRHICAIANMGQDGYLIIGIEDKTWKPIGIPKDSSLANSDETQKQINQILSGRVDPSINVLYRTYPYHDNLIGVVHIPSANPPYIISISDDKYGGQKSDSNRESFIHKGAVYIRRGSDSVVANHQSEIFEVLERRKNILHILGTLGLVAIIVSVGVGVGVSLVKFVDAWVPAIIGGAWGLFIGLLFTHRVIESIGKFPKNWIVSILRGAMAPALGTVVGAWLSFTLADSILRKGIKPLDPLSMGLIIVPTILVIDFLPGILLLLALEHVNFERLFRLVLKQTNRIRR